MLRGALTQTATHWSATGFAGGDPSFAAPAVLSPPTGVRWEDKVERVSNAAGEERVTRSIVYLGVDVAEGDYLFLGTSAQADPRDEPGARRVERFDRSPDLSGREFTRKAYL